MVRSNSAHPSYEVPALEKGLDVLECLAAQGAPLTQARIVRALRRGTNEIFCMLVCLARCGSVERDLIAALGRKSGPRREELLPALRRCGKAIGDSAGLTALQGGVS